jgi:hypothetical protein
MVGRRGEEEVAERPKKPVSGAVAGGVGPTGGARMKVRGTWTLPASCAEGVETPREVPSVERPLAEWMGKTVKVSGTPGEDRPRSRVLGHGRKLEDRKGRAP